MFGIALSLLASLPAYLTCLQGSYSTLLYSYELLFFYFTVCIGALWTRLLDLLAVDCRILCDDAVQEFICGGGAVCAMLCYARLCMHACMRTVHQDSKVLQG